jgi:hypothetical protein
MVRLAALRLAAASFLMARACMRLHAAAYPQRTSPRLRVALPRARRLCQWAQRAAARLGLESGLLRNPEFELELNFKSKLRRELPGLRVRVLPMENQKQEPDPGRSARCGPPRPWAAFGLSLRLTLRLLPRAPPKCPGPGGGPGPLWRAVPYQ